MGSTVVIGLDHGSLLPQRRDPSIADRLFGGIPNMIALEE
jgi:hypothetical protein